MVVIDYGKRGAKLARDLLYKAEGLDKIAKV